MQNIQIERARLYGAAADRRLRPDSHHQHAAAALKCPRCGSLNTKFCYYNNYNLSQPRHFCKSCRRYWTKGGVLRNIPVGGGCRKTTKRSKSKIADVDPPIVTKSNGQSCSSSESSLTASNTTSCSAKLLEQAAIPGDSDRQPPSVNNPPTAAEMHLSGELGFDIPSTTTSYEMEWGNDQALFDLTAYWTDNNHNNSLDYIP